MSALSTPTRALPSAEFAPYVWPVRSGTPPEIGQQVSTTAGNGWSVDYQLRFIDLTYGVWPQSGVARFEYVPADGSLPSIEDLIAGYGLDDMVRVVMYPHLAGTTASASPDTTEPGGGVLLFEGVLQRQSLRIQTAGDREDEGLQLVAVDGPYMDNLTDEHLIRGRWVQDPYESAGTALLIDSPDVPAVFNAGGLPNMITTSPELVADAGDLDLGSALFTFDYDHQATFWTVRNALRSILVYWLFGVEGSPLKRSATLEWATYQALTGADDAGDRWTGLDKVLPEVDVQGLGVYDALAKVCRAGGFEMCVTPALGRAEPEGDDVVAPDRLYQVRVWRAGSGAARNTLKLRKRSVAAEVDADVLGELATNNANNIVGLRDAASVRNRISVVGRTLLEVTVPLKPLWKSADVNGASIDAQLRGDVHSTSGAEYTQRHVQGGADFDQYGHVGRLWGLDCTGAFEAASLGYGSGDALYYHGDGGFNWIDELGIDGDDDLTAARTANAVADPIKWSNRERVALPLTRPGVEQLASPYLLEVSEDGGSSWTRLNASGLFVPLRDRFGIKLDIPNLATVNKDRYSGGSELDSAPDDSWWKLITTKQLQFRLTCLIEADHAARFDAPRDAGSGGTLHTRAALVESEAVEVWASPDSILNDGSTWERIEDGGYGTSSAGADRTANVQDQAERLRDTQGLVRFSISGSTFVMDPGTFQVGDSIEAIDGRSIDLGRTAPGSATARYPSIVRVGVVGWPENAQRIEIDLGDNAIRRGV